MGYPLLTKPGDLLGWARRMVVQLDRDVDEMRNRRGRILKPAMATNAVELDLADAETFWVELTDNLTTITAILPRTTDRVRLDWKLVLEQDGGGSNTVTWPAAWLWEGGTAPTVTATGGAIDMFDFTVIDDTHYGRIFGQDMS